METVLAKKGKVKLQYLKGKRHMSEEGVTS